MNVLAYYAGNQEEALAPLLRIFESMDIKIDVYKFPEQLTEETNTLISNYSHFFYIPGNNSIEDVVSFFAGYFLAKNGNAVVYTHGKFQVPGFLHLLETIDNESSLESYLQRALQKWENQQKVDNAKRQLRNMSISFSEESFFSCVQDGSTKAVEYFLAAEMPVNLRNKKGVPVLSAAVRNQHLAVVELLLQNGADVNMIAADRGNTPLMDACSEGNDELSQILINAGTNVDVTNKNNQSALILAVGCKAVNIAKMLLQNGADTSFKDSLGMTAMQYAGLFGIQSLFTETE